MQNNTAQNGGAIANQNSTTALARLELTDCVLFNNGGASTFFSASATVSAQYSLFEASVTGHSSPNNLTASVSPFASATSAKPRTGSPAINADGPATTTATVGTTDLAGNHRFYNNGRIDIGADGFQGNLCTVGIVSSVKAGLWTDPTVWSCGVVPTSTDVVQVGHAVSIPAGFAAHLARLRYETGSRLVWATGARLLLGL